MNINKCKLILVKEEEIECDKLNNPRLICDFLKDKLELHKEPEEVVMLLALDNKNDLLCCCEVSRGGLDKAFLSPRDVYKRALVANAKSIIIAHNHPAGSLNPSREDESVTRSLKEAGEILDVKLLDHIIISEKGYYSFYEKNPDLVGKKESAIFYSDRINKRKCDLERSI